LVLVTNREDLTADWLVLELERRDQVFLRLCTEDYPSSIGIDLTLERATLYVGAQDLAAAAISSVWWRRPTAPAMPGDRDAERSAWAAREAQTAWEGFWRGVDAHWVNRPEANARADCKPVQLREAHRLGISTAPTLVTNRLDVARAFQRRHGSIVCKALRDGLIPTGSSDHLLYTQRLDLDVLDNLYELGPEPYLFQAFVDKIADVRVTVVGDRVFACRIDSQATPESTVDWRRGDTRDLHHEPIELDDKTTAQLRQLTAQFGLRFAAIDLAIDQAGRYVFFEINPNGQWAWVEQLTGQPLRAALADELTGRR
jgi:hypothetical protein